MSCSQDMAGTQTSHFRSRHGHRACSLQDYARNRLRLAYFVAIFNDLWGGISNIALWCVLALTVERETPTPYAILELSEQWTHPLYLA